MSLIGECLMQLCDGSIRLIEARDLPLVLAWRNSDRIRRQMFSEHIITMEEHCRWFNSLDPTRQRNLLFSFQDNPAGVVNLTGIDCDNQRCSWGFYVGSTDVPRGTGLLMGVLALDYAFERLGVRKICSEALVSNQASCSYHQKLGFTTEGLLKAHIKKGMDFVDVKVFALFEDHWQNHRRDLLEQLLAR